MIVFGTRPEIIKMAPIIEACKKAKVDYFLVHSNQHYDENMSNIFIRELGLEQPEYCLNVGSGTHGAQTGRALMLLEKVIINEKPDAVLVEGDTNTVLAGGIAAVKVGVPIGHIEAGLRSFDLRMPEEHNRRLVDHISTYLFAPTQYAADNLMNEHVLGDIHVTGNPVIDSCMKYVPIAEQKSKIMEKIRFKSFALATIHRTENVDNKQVLRNFVNVFTESEIPIVVSAHPRTVMRLKQAQLWERVFGHKNIQLLPAVGYFDFLVLMKNCDFILTDSGGIQEEATSPEIRKYVFVLRKSTERPEAVDAGMAKVVGTNDEKILHEVKKWVSLDSHIPMNEKCPYGNGKASEKIIQILLRTEKV